MEDGNTCLRVLLLYEDLHTATRVRKAIDRISASAVPEVPVDLEMWKIDLLRVSRLGEMAMEDVLVSDVILVSLHDDQELPPPMRRWLNEWPERPISRPAVLAVWLDAETTSLPGFDGALAGLKRAAERLSLELIPNLADMANGSFVEWFPGQETGAGLTAVTPQSFCRRLAEYTQEPCEEW